MRNKLIYTFTHKRNTWRNSCVIKNTQDAGWGFIVSAYLALLTVAIEDSTNMKFIFVSESDLPVKSFIDMYSRVTMNEDESFVKYIPLKRYDI
jgi:Core-2/I-Branching enzyme